MEAGGVYNSTTVPAGGRNRGYLDNVSYASLNPKRCANVTIVVLGILFFLGGLALSLYGGLFYITVREPREFEMPLERHRREQQMMIYQILLFAGIPVLALGLILWIVYLFRTGRCRYCPLCPGARKRRLRRDEFEAQRMAEEDRISNGYSTHPTTTLPLDEQDRLVKASMDEYAGLEDTDAMLAPTSARPMLVPMQTTI
ncbi:uncharacterized protein LOC122384632 [Amphibalanus amphitrite]|uniref:uncharacterized protein LOC122384632 n=1 Tax=Amphibalanus amphitrite TaxID=1232801 RepID=UPI001C8FC7A6|nr:uncharacterized protein LOC122384632 [Amphibalanus amphitrite]